MREIFYGAAIQGAEDRAKRAYIHRYAIDIIHREGFRILSEHTSGSSKEETARLLEESIGRVPEGINRSSFIRRTMLGLIDSPVSGIIFEVSTPSIGTGIEFDHACTRPQRGIPAAPILALYQTDFWSAGLSTMIKGIAVEELPNFRLAEYTDVSTLANVLREFLSQLTNY